MNNERFHSLLAMLLVQEKVLVDPLTYSEFLTCIDVSSEKAKRLLFKYGRSKRVDGDESFPYFIEMRLEI